MTVLVNSPGLVDVDLVTYEVVRHRLLAIVAQQSIVLKNVSGSPLVTDANDCNTGIYLPNGEIVAMGPHIIFHSGSMEMVVSHIIADCEEDPGIQDGDSFITNDPYKGALHMPDVTMIDPLFVDGVRVGWVGSCAHVLDIGGMTPSSYCPDSTEIYQEGLILPPTKLVSNGRIRSDVWRLILSASRLPANLGLDLKAMIAANAHAKKGFLRLVQRYGIEVVTSVMHTMLDRSEAQFRERLETLPDSTFRSRNYFDYDGKRPVISRVEVEMTKAGDSLVFDYSNSSPQMNGFFNCTMSGVRGGTFAAMLPQLCYDIPWNSGIMRAVEIVAPEGIVVNAKHPAPCGAATVGGTYMVDNTAGTTIAMLASISPELRDDAMACTTGSISVLHMGGLNQYHEPFGAALTDALAGGGGATVNGNGLDVAGPQEILTYRFTNVEGDEALFPLLYLSRYLNADGGGAGRHTGGVSGGSAFTVYDAAFLHAVTAAHGMSVPTTSGLHGGMPGSCHQISIVRGSDVHEKLGSGAGPVRAVDVVGAATSYDSAPGEFMLFPGDVMDWSWHGGGGWGDPLEADPLAVAEDASKGRITHQAAEDLYGVQLTAEGSVDVPGTDALRRARRQERMAWARTADRHDVDLADAELTFRIGDHLGMYRSRSGAAVIGCDCGTALAVGGDNWKDRAAHRELQAHEVGAKVRLHPDLIADAYACPGCGVLLGFEVRWNADAPLNDVEVGA